MITYEIYYQDYEQQSPSLMVIDVKNSDINWDDDILLIPVPVQPFEIHSIDSIDYDSMNLSVLMNELTVNKSINHFGINLDLLKCRLNEHGGLPSDISNLMIRLCDLEEILHMAI